MEDPREGIPPEDWSELMRGKRCKANRTDGSGRCQKLAMIGLDVCRTHGGWNPKARAKSEVARAERKSRRELERVAKRFDLRVDVSPSQALLDEVKWTAGHVKYLRSKVQALDEELLAFGVDEIKTDASGKVQRRLTAAENVWYSMYLKERKHLVEVCRAAVSSGIEERQVRLAESQGMLVAETMRRILDTLETELERLGLPVSEHWDGIVREVVPREFRLLGAG